jgi:hypothetical protein
MADTNLRIKIGMQGSAEVNAGLKAIGAAASNLKGALAGIAAAVGGVMGLNAAIQQSVRFNAQLEQQGVAFKTLLGNAEAASRRMAELARFAAQTPFELPEIVQASKVLQSLTNGALASGEGLRLVGDAAAATGRPLEEAAMWIGRLYAGLQSGTPVGEATLRLIEMGLISGTTARKLNELAESGQGAGQAMTVLRDTFGRLGGAMADQSQTFNGLLSTLKDTFNMALADIGKPLFDGLKQGISELIPVVEGLGEKISAWVSIAIQSFRDGRLSEFIGLNIEAGFEIGISAAVKVLEKLFDWLGSPMLWQVIGNGLLTAINEAMKLAGAAMVDFLLVPLGSIASYIKDAFSYAFESVVDFFAADLEKVINAAADLLNSVFGTNLSQVSLTGGSRVFQAPDFMRSFGENQEGGQVLKEGLTKFFDESTAAGRELMGVGAGLSIGTSALDSLTKLVAQTVAASKAAKSAGAGAGGNTPEEELRVANVREASKLLELQMTERLAQINAQRATSEGSWLTTSAQKFRERKQLLEAEYKVIVDQMRAYEQLRDIATTAEEQQQMQARVSALGAQGVGVLNQRQAMGPSPESFGENFQATVVQLQNQFGTVAQQMAATFADVFNSAISSISNGITGLILGTMSWGQALAMIGTTILTTIVQSIVQMGVRWVATQILMATVGKSIMAASLAATMPIAAASSAVWATPATLATIASYGAAAAAAPGFILGAQGMVLAQSLAAFKTGGYTGDGNPNDVAGIVHRGEFVVPADAVDRIGLSTLQAMTAAGASDPGAFTSPAAPGPITLNMGVFDNPGRLADWAKSNEGRTVLVDIMRQHAHEFSRA